MKHFKSIGAFHRFRGLPPPDHSLISVIDISRITRLNPEEPASLVFDFYGIALKRTPHLNARYGQQPMDPGEGVMSFTAPKQVIKLFHEVDAPLQLKGYVIYVHPDFFWNTSLSTTIRRYDFFDYAVNEALILSEKEEKKVLGIIQNIESESQANLDRFSKQIIVSHLETLLNYADRFYHRQFLTREKANHEILERLQSMLDDYFANDALIATGPPSVKYISEQLHLSPKYLSSLLRVQTGQSTQQHIQDTLIRRAKEQLSTTSLSVSEIAYALGFEHLQSFSKLFKTKTRQSPLEFRQSFN